MSNKRYPEEFKIEAVRQIDIEHFLVLSPKSDAFDNAHSFYAFLHEFILINEKLLD